MKKVFFVLLGVFMAFSTNLNFGCGNKNEKSNINDKNSQSGLNPEQAILMPEPYEKLKKESLEEVSIDFVPSFDDENVKAIEYSGAKYEGKNTKVFAFLGYPENINEKEKYPAVVLVHGGNGTAYAEWVKIWNRRGCIAIAMDTEGARVDGTRNGLGGPSNDTISTSNKKIEDQWMYQAVSCVIRATTILCNDNMVDNNKIGIVGISWGSVITGIALGCDTRYAFGVPVYGSGYLDESLSGFKMYEINSRGYELWNPNLYFSKYNAK